MIAIACDGGGSPERELPPRMRSSRARERAARSFARLDRDCHRTAGGQATDRRATSIGRPWNGIA